jgi:hypothetical protein
MLDEIRSSVGSLTYRPKKLIEATLPQTFLCLWVRPDGDKWIAMRPNSFRVRLVATQRRGFHPRPVGKGEVAGAEKACLFRRLRFLCSSRPISFATAPNTSPLSLAASPATQPIAARGSALCLPASMTQPSENGALDGRRAASIHARVPPASRIAISPFDSRSRSGERALVRGINPIEAGGFP